MNFSMAAWREYCLEHVEATTTEQKARLTRLVDTRNPDNETAWANLAADIKHIPFCEADGTPCVLEWREALHSVIGVLVFPPVAIAPPSKSKYQKALDAAEALREAIRDLGEHSYRNPSDLPVFLGWNCLRGTSGHPVTPIELIRLDELVEEIKALMNGRMPLMPGKNTGKNAYRNWLTLYLRDCIIKPLFTTPHHEDIARLVNSALGELDMEAVNVRLLKPRSPDHP